jgi:hypothetical protein
MEATCSSETSTDFQRTTRRYIPEDSITLQNHRCENLKSYMLMVNVYIKLNISLILRLFLHVVFYLTSYNFQNIIWSVQCQGYGLATGAQLPAETRILPFAVTMRLPPVPRILSPGAKLTTHLHLWPRLIYVLILVV